jgi:hypothetical protein
VLHPSKSNSHKKNISYILTYLKMAKIWTSKLIWILSELINCTKFFSFWSVSPIRIIFSDLCKALVFGFIFAIRVFYLKSSIFIDIFERTVWQLIVGQCQYDSRNFCLRIIQQCNHFWSKHIMKSCYSISDRTHSVLSSCISIKFKLTFNTQ